MFRSKAPPGRRARGSVLRALRRGDHRGAAGRARAATASATRRWHSRCRLTTYHRVKEYDDERHHRRRAVSPATPPPR